VIESVLAKICAAKREHIRAQRKAKPLSAIDSEAKAASPVRGFAASLDRAVARTGTGLIAEVKRASPSKGTLRAEFAPAELAKAYQTGGAACLSVLTDTPYFQGSDADLVAARNAVILPVIRKDFLLDPYQIVESRALGADCVLMILAALDDMQAAELASAAAEWKMDTLVELHDEKELERAAHIGGTLLGVNNRNLKTLAIDLATTERLAPRAPKGTPVVCESGIESAADVQRMHRIGVHRFLVGSALMLQPDVTAAVRALLSPGPRASGLEVGATARGM
jgi:indole-3-glycerol phosphate synthase